MSSIRPQFAETIARIGNEDKNLFVMVGDISHGLLTKFRTEHPDRYRNIGICEPSMISLAAGLNVAGFNPVVHTITPFLIERTFEQIKLDFGYQKLDCNLVSVGSSFDYAKLGCSHHSYIDLALVASVEGSKVFVPGSKLEFDYLFTENYKTPGIKYFRLTENGHGLDQLTKSTKSGKNLVVRKGKDLTIVALGPSLKSAIFVADKLLQSQLSAEVVYVNSFKPFDTKTVFESVQKTGTLVTVSEISDVGGLRNLCLDAISGKFTFKSIDFSVKKFVRGYGDTEDLMDRAGISEAYIYEKVLELLRV